MSIDAGELNSDLDQPATPPTRRGRRILSSVTGNLGSFWIILGVLGLLLMSFVGSSVAVSSSVRSAFGREDVRRAVADELVDRMQNGDDIGIKIVIHVARDKVVDSIEQSFRDNEIRSAAGETASSAYEFLIGGRTNVVIDIQYFADAAFKAMRAADPLIPQFLAPQVDPIDLSRDADGSDFSAIRGWVLLATWGLLLGGLALSIASWFLSPALRWLKVRRMGVRFFVWGLVLIGLAYAARSISFSDDTSGPLAEALVAFATSRLLVWSFVLTGIAGLVAVIGAIMNRRVTSTRTASA
ncbi:MAG: hypothetical protein ABIU98_08550 [Ilumatobacteraceae bacterium]